METKKIWNRHYSLTTSSGKGSEGELYQFKREIIKNFIEEKKLILL